MNKRSPVEHDVIEPVARRWSPRAFAPKAVPRAELLRVLEAARWAASCYNEQPWRFIVVTSDRPEAFAAALSCLRRGNQGWARLAPVLMFVLAKTTFSNTGGNNRHALHDVGQAVAQLSLQAAAQDLCVHQMAGVHPERVLETYGIRDLEVVSALALGYLGDLSRLPEDLRAKERRERTRKPLSELVLGGL